MFLFVCLPCFGVEWTDAQRDFWSYQRPVAGALPGVEAKGWARSDLDYFVLARLEDAGLAPSADAEVGVLLRRLYFDVIGLGPTPGEVKAFKGEVESGGLDAALVEVVDRLLASERFGERWGRMWMDVARYAESSGKDSNFTFPYAWRYRDYVIDAFNGDKPFDHFVTEQIAGDLLEYETDTERAKLLIATGYLAFGPKGLNEADEKIFLAEEVDEQIDAVTRGIIASTVACARCHDHPSDPFTMEDYYGLAGIFKSTESCYGTPVGPSNNRGGVLMTLPAGARAEVLHKSVKAEQVQGFHDEMDALKVENETLMATRKLTLQDAIRIKWRKGNLTGRLEKYDSTGVAQPLVMGVREKVEVGDTELLERGELSRPGETVGRGFPAIVKLNDEVEIDAGQSGRLALARWLTSADHPLTSRVIANRIWRNLFGTGLVRTVDQFGYDGEAPSHPALLDHLALGFMDEGWSVKSFVRRVVLSRTYRQASDYRKGAFEVDPDNRLLWRVSKRRLTAEAIRDAMLAASGELDLSRPVGSLVGKIGDKPISIIGFDKRMPADIDGMKNRSVYLPVMRDKLPDVLELFDFAEPSMVTGDRPTTNVPLQSLYLMNSEFVTERASGLARRILKEQPKREGRGQLRRAFELCLARQPDAEELAMGELFLERGVALGQKREGVLAGYCHSLFCAAEFRYVD